MTTPGEQTWLRVELLAEEFGKLPANLAADRMIELAANGESPTVMTLLGAWLELSPVAAPLKAGREIGKRYVLREKLGEGGMGAVWRATQKIIDRDVALKMIHPTLVTPAFKARFEDEIKLLGQLNHPSIVQIFDAGMDEEPGEPAIPYFAMEFVEGRSLDRWAAEHRGDWEGQLHLVAGICAALQSAHDRGIVHRDLKPANILIKRDGQPMVLDFGIARLAGIAMGDEPGEFSGTPQYAAPEQHLGRDREFRSGESVDVYALGAILFEVISGRRLFQFPRGTPISEMRRAVLEDVPPRLSDVVKDCPDPVDEIVAKAVRRNPADRYYSVAALGRAVARAAQGIASGKPVLPRWTPAVDQFVPLTSWKLERKIGEGGAGEVWVGIHEQLKERRVFKFCDSEEKARTLKREFTLFRLLKDRIGQNPHFIPLHEVSLDEHPWYLMMDYTDACDLDAWCARWPGGLAALPLEVRLEIVAQTAEALQAAHEAGILHRDIKPANLLVRDEAGSRSSSDGSGETAAGLPGGGGGTLGAAPSPQVHVLIADFGIGQITAGELLFSDTPLGFTRTVSELQRASLSGTMLYLAPEVLAGAAATARSDLYSLGVVLWQLLIGNLNIALDATDWAERISDPLLRADLARCLAGSPEKRWASAGEFAASLRSLTARREADARRRAELAARERAAYRRGVARTTAVAAAIVLAVGTLAWVAWVQRRAAERSRGEIALKQAEAIGQVDLAPGRRERGLRLLDASVGVVADAPALRSAAAKVIGLVDTARALSPDLADKPAAGANLPAAPGETCRTISGDGALTALARDRDGLSGAIDLIETETGRVRFTIERKQFPWIPIAEPGLLRFSPDGALLAIGGAATSRHVLIADVLSGNVRAYLFSGADLLACAWHPGSRLLATAGADGSLRVWDIAAAVSPGTNVLAGNQFALPPALDLPALDFPLCTLSGHRGPVRHVAFSPDGRWLASIDETGYLRIHLGFSDSGLPEPSSPGRAKALALEQPGYDPTLSLEMRLEHVETITELASLRDAVVIRRGNSVGEELKLLPSELPEELALAPGITDVAWNAEGTELCATSLTDVHWLRLSPLELRHSSSGENPIGVSGAAGDGYWVLPKEKHYFECRLQGEGAGKSMTKGASFPLAEAVKGQAARTSMTASSNGRIAIYRGRRIQFFANHQPAPEESSIVADGGGGIFQEIMWDTMGRTLGAVFALPNGNLRVETWETTVEFPPKCQLLPTRELATHRLVPANDGQHFLARGRRQGIARINPVTGSETTLDASDFARQHAPLAATADGKFLALVVDRNTIRLLKLPGGTFFAELRSPRSSGITKLVWHASGRLLASVTEDGYLQAWHLGPWQDWLAQHHLNK